MKKFDTLSVLLETSSGITPKPETVKRFIKIISEMGYDRLYLGMADAYKIEGEPYFGYKRGGYTKRDFKEMDEFAKDCGVELVPQIQLLGHLHYLKKFPCYTELFDTEDTLIVGEERVYELIEKMIKTVSEGLSSRTIHIGLDETFGLGTGNYLKNHPPKDKKELIIEHIDRVQKILDKYGYKSVKAWGDMLTEKGDFKYSPQEVKERLPKNMSVVVWNYEEKSEEKLFGLIDEGRKVSDRVEFAGAVWKYLGFGPNNAFSADCILSQMKSCFKHGVKDYIVTLWADAIAPCSNFAALPSLYAAAEYANGTIESLCDIDKDRFRKTAGIGYDELYALEYLDNPFKESCTTRSSSSVWALYSDVLLGNFDTLIPKNADQAYMKLASEYKNSFGGEYGYIFRMSAALCETLAVRSDISARIRDAYAAKDISAMREIVPRVEKLKSKLKEFTDEFKNYYFHDNMSFGIEVYHIRLGGLIQRAEYTQERLNAFINNGERIEELEGGILPLGYDPMPTISCSIMTDPKMLVSYCI